MSKVTEEAVKNALETVKSNLDEKAFKTYGRQCDLLLKMPKAGDSLETIVNWRAKYSDLMKLLTKEISGFPMTDDIRMAASRHALDITTTPSLPSSPSHSRLMTSDEFSKKYMEQLVIQLQHQYDLHKNQLPGKKSIFTSTNSTFTENYLKNALSELNDSPAGKDLANNKDHKELFGNLETQVRKLITGHEVTATSLRTELNKIVPDAIPDPKIAAKSVIKE